MKTAAAAFVFLLPLLLIDAPSSAFYLPGVAPRDFQKGDELQVKVNKLSSTKTQLPYDYYFLDYCKPGKIENSAENLGEVLRGDRIENSVYTFKMRSDETCKVACRTKLTRDATKNFKEKINDEYRVNMILDKLPVAVPWQMRDGSRAPNYEHKYYINNHLSFKISELHGKMMGERQIYVAIAQRKEERREKLQAFSSQGNACSSPSPVLSATVAMPTSATPILSAVAAIPTPSMPMQPPSTSSPSPHQAAPMPMPAQTFGNYGFHALVPQPTPVTQHPVANPYFMRQPDNPNFMRQPAMNPNFQRQGQLRHGHMSHPMQQQQHWMQYNASFMHMQYSFNNMMNPGTIHPGVTVPLMMPIHYDMRSMHHDPRIVTYPPSAMQAPAQVQYPPPPSNPATTFASSSAFAAQNHSPSLLDKQ